MQTISDDVSEPSMISGRLRFWAAGAVCVFRRISDSDPILAGQ
jgi:hypothetical protein